MSDEAPVIPGLLSSEDFLASIPVYDETKDYLGALLRGGQRVTVTGKMGEGKTSLLMEMASAVARSSNFLGFRGAGVPVLFVNLEMGEEQIGDAMRAARLPHGNFDILQRPDGMQIDCRTPQGDADRRLLWEYAGRFRVVIFDPWYQMLHVELPESNIVGSVIRFLQALQKRHQETCFVFGKHLQEQSQKSSIGAISGFKAFERNADTIIGMERVANTDTSRLRWLKVRSPHRLGVKMGERWMVEWVRDEGFSRVDHQSSTGQVLELMADGEWWSTLDVCEKWGRDRSQASKVLNLLHAEKKIECSGDSAGRKPKFWRVVNEDQGVLDDFVPA